MKKIAAILLTILMTSSLAACGNSGKEKNDASSAKTEEKTKISEQESEDSKTEEPASGTETADVTDETENPDDAGGNEDAGGTNVLVAYFSATNTTKGVAEHISDSLGADLYEIVPQEPYTDDDLDYNDDNSRSTVEMNDPAARPAISGSVDNMDQYDIVFIGYPIWWGDAPRIVSTFVESYEFTGKTVVPFCTSGGSGMGSSASNLEKLTDGANWLSGDRLDGGSSREEIVDWVNGLGLDVTAK